VPKPKTPKRCEDCGSEFWPNSGVQKRCIPCREKREAKPAKKRRGKAPTIKGKRAATTSEPAKPKRRARADAVSAGVASRLGYRLRQIDDESYARFREEKEADDGAV
jgi:hypothetical protein